MSQPDFSRDIMPLRDSLLAVAQRIVGDSNEAEDIVQDTMLKVLSVSERWHTIDNLQAYCITVCRNLALDRQKSAHHRLTQPIDDSHDAPSHEPSPLQHLANGDTRLAISACIRQLPPLQQSIITLREFEGCTYDEIATRLNINQSQVKVYLMRARQRLRSLLQTKNL